MPIFIFPKNSGINLWGRISEGPVGRIQEVTLEEISDRISGKISGGNFWVF